VALAGHATTAKVWDLTTLEARDLMCGGAAMMFDKAHNYRSADGMRQVRADGADKQR
jgi:hypothetical protein